MKYLISLSCSAPGVFTSAVNRRQTVTWKRHRVIRSKLPQYSLQVPTHPSDHIDLSPFCNNTVELQNLQIFLHFSGEARYSEDWGGGEGEGGGENWPRAACYIITGAGTIASFRQHAYGCHHSAGITLMWSENESTSGVTSWHLQPVQSAVSWASVGSSNYTLTGDTHVFYQRSAYVLYIILQVVSEDDLL